MTETKTLCVNGKRYFHSYETKEIHVSLDLLTWLDAQKSDIKCYWQGRDGAEIACVGSVLFLNEIPRFEPGHESPAKFWGGHRFFLTSALKDDSWDGFPSVAFFLPRHQLQKKAGKIQLLSNSINGPLNEKIDLSRISHQTLGKLETSVSPLHPRISLGKVYKPSLRKLLGASKKQSAQSSSRAGEKCGLFPTPFSNDNSKYTMPTAGHLPSSEDWMQLIKHSLDQIQGKIFEKVVMARRSTFVANANALKMLSKLKLHGAIRFAFQFNEGKIFIGATPERLYKRDGRLLYTEAIAGTRPLGRGSELFNDPKELKEFCFVKTSIQKNLEPLCSSINCSKENLVQAASLTHLCSSMDATLKDEVSDEQILGALHPTAAMGGLPRESALNHLLDHEPFERGWYASPLGYISAKKTEFAVGIRSALVETSKIHLFAGAGIVNDSIPEKEWEELEHKTAIWKSL